MKEERRSIDTKFWTDPSVEDMSKNATYLFNSLLSLPENNMAGVYEITERKISYYTKMSEQEVNEAFRELELKGKIRRVNHWLGIKNHIKNQKISNGNMAISVVKDLCKAPNEIKIWLYYKPDSTVLEEWMQTIVFKVNSYFKEQRKRVITKKAKEIGQEEAELLYPEITINKEQLVKITTEELPFHRNDISNFFNFLTITSWLQHSPTKKEVEDRRLKNEVLKGEVEREREVQVNNRPFQGFQSASIERDYISEYEDHKNQWNSLSLPECRKLPHNIPNWGEILNSMQLYTLEEITAAINNYAELQPREKAITYSTFPNFLVKGIEKYADSSKPYDTFKETQDEKEIRQKQEAYEALEATS